MTKDNIEKEEKEAIEAEFKNNVKRIKEDFKSDPNGAAKNLHPLIDRRTMGRIFKYGTPDEEPISLINKTRLNYHYNQPQGKTTYRLIANQMKQKQQDTDFILETFCGDYNYYRFYPPTNNPNDLVYVKGRIEIKADDLVPTFKHWSHNWEPEDPKEPDEAEHKGFVFRNEQSLFLIGARSSVLRLAIAECPTNPKDGTFHGVLASRRTDIPKNAYAARFLMVRKENTARNAELDPRRGLEAEKRWYEISGGDYSYLMLASPFKG